MEDKMSFFNKIKNAIFGKAEAASLTPAQAESATNSSPTPMEPVRSDADTAKSNVDVAAVLDAAVKQSGQKLDWKHSIVDLLKSLNLDSGLSARKELAEELGYTGDTSDSASMNIWLHKAVIKKLSDNGGKVPAELLQ